MEQVRQIPQRVLDSLWIDGYFKAFWAKVQENCTHAEAYQYVEDQLKMYWLPPRYSSYESFKRGKAYFWDKSEPVLRFF